MKRHLRLYLSFVKTSLVTELQYRENFFLLTLINFGWGLVYVFLYVFIFQHIDQVGDWTYERSLVLAATFLLVHSLVKSLFRQNLKKIARFVYLGELDSVLLKPVSPQFYLSLRQFYLRPFIRFILGWFILGYVLVQNNITVSLASVVLYLFFLLTSCLIVYSLWFMSCLLSFWFGNIENIYELFHPILRVTALPFDILPGLLANIFFYLLPLTFITTIPAKALLGLISFPYLLYGVFISLLLLFLSSKLLAFALKYYQSVG